ncbi:hypothetical protein CARUB_v10010714mg [Capsella rubella]|uniref:Uncharacterized protein n=1 Tax=Capsella rubella TaxID=81985 RepID=R0IDS2_9BRAS|nr:hypothetical protein CARUB_v10010714mg [Capsella rubella]
MIANLVFEINSAQISLILLETDDVAGINHLRPSFPVDDEVDLIDEQSKSKSGYVHQIDSESASVVRNRSVGSTIRHYKVLQSRHRLLFDLLYRHLSSDEAYAI